MTVHDAAAYILEQGGEMTAMKLQKLVYYSQCWSLVWDETPLFEEVIEAWANGPVSPDLYAAHKGRFKVAPGSIPGNSSTLSADQRATIDEVMKFYGAKSAQWLSDLTHLEAPWRMARERAGASDGQNCQEPITLSDMHEYYSGLGQEPAKE